MLARSLIVWLAILVLAVLNGIFREAVLLPGLGHDRAYTASGLILSALILAATLALARWLRLASARRALGVGALWLGLTLAFEFGVGIVQGRSWPDMLSAYTFRDGNIWPIVLAVVLFAPLVAWRARKT